MEYEDIEKTPRKVGSIRQWLSETRRRTFNKAVSLQLQVSSTNVATEIREIPKASASSLDNE